MTKISVNDVIYDPINNKIGVVRALHTGPETQALVFYGDSEKLMTGKRCKKTTAWLAFEYWKKLGTL